ncbi:MAG: 8-oxo-dGTP diphosphatase [Parcubacteria group bacterium]|nr:8-oxo-dGTP diphosphatase [Parcubacteria group bacterium]
MNKKVLILCVVHKHPHVLLGMKKRGFGMGKWNGFGGKVEEGETVEVAAKRELFEESGLEASVLNRVGILDFAWKDKPDEMEVHVFLACDMKGEPMESEEMRPEWFHVDEIPFHAMWADDKHWMPLLLADKKFKGRFVFDDQDQMLEHVLNEVLEI